MFGFRRNGKHHVDSIFTNDLQIHESIVMDFLGHVA